MEREQQGKSAAANTSLTLTVGKIVQVEARTWPGINKPGGVGRITQLHYSEDGQVITSVDVRYTVVGGRERHVPIEHVEAAPEFDVSAQASKGDASSQSKQRNQLRDRSGLLGRCKRCGSLRADCGSCDWIEQERLAEQARNQSEQEPSANSQPRRKKAGARKRRIQVFEQELLSSSSEDEEQIKADNIRRRRYQRQRSYWLHAFDDSASDSDELEKSHEESSSDSDDSLPARLAEWTRNRREEKKRNLARKYSRATKKRRRKRPRSTGLSSLETLQAPPVSASKEKTAKSPEQRMAQSPELGDTLRQVESDNEVEDVGDPDISSTDDSMIPPPREASAETRVEEESDEDVVDVPDTSLDLEGLGFIQPEGEAAAEHLPSDIVDRTKSIPYKRLPSFFDELLKKLEDEIIPDSQLAMSEFQLKTREARRHNDNDTLQRLREEGDLLYNEIQRKVIKDGVDQCCEAMRRMTNSRQRVRHKKEMTKREQKEFRGTALEVRDTKLDLLIPLAEKLLRDAGAALLDEFRAADEVEIGDDEISDSGESSDPSPSILTQDLISSSTVHQSDMDFGADEDAPLPPFDPHMHATTVRTKGSRKRSGRKREPEGRSRRKRRKQPDGTSLRRDANVPDFTSNNEAASRKQKRRRDQKERRSSVSQESDSSLISDGDVCLSEGGSMSFEANDPAPHQRRRRVRSKARGDRERPGFQFPTENTTNERSANRIPVADRMQAFLDANSSNIDDFDGFSHHSDGSRENTARASRKRHRDRHRRTRQSREASRRTQASDDNDIASLDGDDLPQREDESPANSQTGVSTDAFYRRVERKKRASPMRNESVNRPMVSLSDSCNTLLSTYCESTDDCASIFNGIVHHFKAQTTVINSEAAEVFAALVQLLQEHGSMVLQAVALTRPNIFKCHIRLLVFALNLLDCKVHTALIDDGGVAFKLFGREKWKAFVETILLQMLDVIYAWVQPVCWGLEGNNISGVVEKLAPLRDAIGTLVPMVETASHCIMDKFQCQSWRQLDGGLGSFVSAIDPQEYKSLLLTGNNTSAAPSPGSVRFQCFKKAIPRNEMETIWLILAFCAESPTAVCDGPKHRWRLVSSLFGSSTGVMSKDYFESTNKDEISLPPEKGHIARCQTEMIRFRVLVSSASLNPLPDSDSFLTKLVQKSLMLQEQEYRYSSSEGTREMLSDLDEMDRSRVLQTWKATNLLNDADCDDIEKPSRHGRSNGRMSGLQPTSGLLESCLDLSMAWVAQVPKKRARRSRLTQSLQKLVADCIERASKLEVSNAEGDQAVSGSTFEEAFAVQTSNIGSMYAATAYRETAARLSVLGAIDGSHEMVLSLTKELRETTWERTSDPELKQRQQRIIALESVSQDKYDGDQFRLLSAAKTISWLAHLHWMPLYGRDAAASLGSLPETVTAELDDDDGMFVFLASCLCACLDCACDMFQLQTNRVVLQDEEATSRFEGVSSVVSCISLWLSQLCVRSRVVLRTNATPAETPVLRLRKAAKDLRQKIFGIVASPLKKSLLCLTNSTFYGENADVALVSVLGLVRAVAGLASCSLEEHGTEPPAAAVENDSSAHHAQNPPDDDLFGSMDDALFMGIDLGDADQGVQSTNARGANGTDDKDIQAFKEIWTLLIDMVKLAKPSDRFAVLAPTMPRLSARACMSIPGRTRAANNTGEICACLAALTSLRQCDSSTVNTSLNTFICSLTVQGWNARDDADQSYLRSVAQCFYSEVCCLSKEYEQCDRLLQQRWENVVEHFVDAMLDSNTLERFPSMNLKRIKENGGVRSERKQSLRLKLANSTRRPEDATRDSVNTVGARLGKNEKENCPGPAYNSSHLWPFCKSLGKAIARQEELSGAADQDSAASKLFVELNSDLVDRPRDPIPFVSLEKECVRRFMLFRGILSFSAKQGSTGGALSFESLACQIISSCCYQLASISKGVDYQARFGRTDAKNGIKSYRHARLLELQSCYTEFTVALMSWILRECPAPKSMTLEATLQCVRDQLFSQVILRKTTDVLESLRHLYTVATPEAVSNNTAARTSTRIESGEYSVLNDISVSIVRRSHQIMLHLASDLQDNGMRNVYCLLNSLVALAIETPSQSDEREDFSLDLIAKSMDLDNPVSSAVSRLSTGTSPFQRALDGYVRHVELDGDSDNEQATCLQQLRHVTIRQFLAPKLLKDEVLLSQKKGVLRFMSNIVQIEVRTGSSAPQEGLEIQLIASMAKGIASCVRAALESHAVDDEFVCQAFQCSRSLLALPSPLEDEATVLSWSRHCKDDNDNAKPPNALYLWTFATWMNNVGKMLVGGTEQDEQSFQDFRSKAISLATQGRSIWSVEGDNDIGIVKDSFRLVSLEPKVFAEKENTRPLTNVYAKSKSRPQPSSASIDTSEWFPSSSVRRAAKELQAQVIGVL